MKKPKSILSRNVLLLFVIAIAKLLPMNELLAQGAVYPIVIDVCETAGSFELEWVGTGSVKNWQEKRVSSDWVDIADTNKLRTFATPAPGVYKYRVVINSGVEEYSNYSTVTVYAESKADNALGFTIINNDGCSGDNDGEIDFDTGYTGEIINWVYSYSGKAPWSDLNQLNKRLEFEDIDKTTYYKVKIKNGVCPSVLSSNTAKINIIEKPTAGSIVADNYSVCDGDEVELTISNNTGTEVEWFRYISDTPVSQFRGSAYTTNELDPGNYIYVARSWSSSCRNSAGIDTALFSDSERVNITASSNSQSANLSDDVVVRYNDNNLSSINATLVNGEVLRWEYSPDNLTWTSITNQTNTQNYRNLTTTRYYRVVTQNGSCPEAISNSTKLTVASGGEILSTNTNFCLGDVEGTLTNNEIVGSNWKWEYSVFPFTVWNMITQNVTQYNFNGLTETTIYRVNVNNGKAYSDTVAINVKPPTNAGTLSTDNSVVCISDATIRQINLDGEVGDVVRWESSEHNGEPWNKIEESEVSLTFNKLNKSTYYRAIVKNGACEESASPSIKILVAEGGSVIPNNMVCNSDLTVHTLSLKNYSGNIERWEKSEYNKLSETWSIWSDIGNSGSNVYNYSNLTVSTRFRAIIGSACDTDVTSDYAEIMVYDLSYGGEVRGSKIVRSGDNSGNIVLSGNTGSVIRWESSVTPGGGEPWVYINNKSSILSYTNISKTTYYRAVVKNGPCQEIASSSLGVITVANSGYITGSCKLCNSDSNVRELKLLEYLGNINRWEKSENGGDSWSPLPNSSGKDSYSYSNLNKTTIYRAVISEDNGEIFSKTATVTINNKPVVDFTIGNVCQNSEIQFTNITTTESDFIINSDWDFGDGNFSATLNPKHIFGESGLHKVKLIVVTSESCIDSVVKNINVNPLPETDFEFENVCFGEDVEFENKSELTGATLTYKWSFGDMFTSTNKNPDHLYNSEGSYDVKLIVTTNTACKDSISKTLVVYPLPVPKFSFDNVCASTLFSPKNISMVPDGNMTYRWKFGDNITYEEESPEHIFAVPDSYEIKLVANSIYGCTDSVTDILVVNPVPVSDFVTESGCHNQITRFDNRSSISSGVFSSEWEFGNGITSSKVSPEYMFPNIGTFQVKLSVISSHNCKSEVTKSVEIYPVPQVHFDFNDVCEDDSVKFINYTTITGGNLSYSWNFGNAETSVLQNPSTIYSSHGRYNVKLKASSSGGCTDSLVKRLNIHENPIANFTFENVCSDDEISFNNTTNLNNGEFKSFNWDFGDGKTSNLKNPVYTYTDSGNYVVNLGVVSDNGCVDTSSKVIRIYPSPQVEFDFVSGCAKSPVVFTNRSKVYTEDVIYNWEFGDGTGESNDENPTYSYAVAGDFYAKLKIKDAQGCKGEKTHNVKSYFRALPDFEYSLACAEKEVEFKNTTDFSSGSYVSKWIFEPDVSSNKMHGEHIFQVAKDYPVKLKVTTSDGCIDSVIKRVEVHKQPKASFVADNVCYGNKTVFNNTTTDLDDKMFWIWDFGDQDESKIPTEEHFYTSPGTYLVTLDAISDKGCESRFRDIVKVYPQPVANFNFNNTCSGSDIRFDNLSSISSGRVSYLWNFNNGSSSTDKSPLISFQESGSYNVRLLVKSDLSCTDTIIKEIVIHPNPEVSFSADAVCNGNKAIFTVNTEHDNIKSYLWDFGDGINSLQKSPKHLFSRAGEHEVSLICETENGCVSVTKKNIGVRFVPKVDFTAEDVCIGQQTLFNNNTSIQNGVTDNFQYEWYLDGEKRFNIMSPKYLFQSPGEYEVKLKVNDASTSCYDSIIKTVVVHSLPKVDAGVDTTISKGFPLEMYAEAEEGNYLWSPDSSLLNSVVLNTECYATEKTNYVLEVEDSNGCSNRDTVVVNVNSDYKLYKIDVTASNVITPDGNGENDLWIIKNIDMYDDNRVQIFNRWGTMVYSAQNYMNDWDGKNLAGDVLPDGTYYYVVYFEKSDVVYKGAITILRNSN